MVSDLPHNGLCLASATTRTQTPAALYTYHCHTLLTRKNGRTRNKEAEKKKTQQKSPKIE